MSEVRQSKTVVLVRSIIPLHRALRQGPTLSFRCQHHRGSGLPEAFRSLAVIAEPVDAVRWHHSQACACQAPSDGLASFVQRVGPEYP